MKKAGIILDPEARTAKTSDAMLNLTRKEFDLLNIFMGEPGKVLSPNHLLETVWGYGPALYNDPHTIEVHASSLIKKLGKKIS